MGKTRQTANLVSNNQITVDTANQRVGIGSTNPSQVFDIRGNLKVSGTIQNASSIAFSIAFS
jgi:hypothetical protein